MISPRGALVWGGGAPGLARTREYDGYCNTFSAGDARSGAGYRRRWVQESGTWYAGHEQPGRVGSDHGVRDQRRGDDDSDAWLADVFRGTSHVARVHSAGTGLGGEGEDSSVGGYGGALGTASADGAGPLIGRNIVAGDSIGECIEWRLGDRPAGGSHSGGWCRGGRPESV